MTDGKIWFGCMALPLEINRCTYKGIGIQRGGGGGHSPWSPPFLGHFGKDLKKKDIVLSMFAPPFEFLCAPLLLTCSVCIICTSSGRIVRRISARGASVTSNRGPEKKNMLEMKD